MNSVLKRSWEQIKKAAAAWLEHDGPRLGASLALYSLLSLAPLVVLSITMASLAVGRSAARSAILAEIHRLAGADGVKTIQTVIEHGKTGHRGLAATGLGLLILLIGASSVFGELQSGLNRVWNTQPPRVGGLWPFVKSRLLSFALVLAFIFLLIVSLVFSATVTAFDTYVSDYLSVPSGVLHVVDSVISLIAVSILLGLVLRYVPDVNLRWRDVWQGALVTGVLFTVGKAFLGFYLGKSMVGSAYGTAGSLVVLVLWVYYFAMIFYFGAEFTKARSDVLGVDSSARPSGA